MNCNYELAREIYEEGMKLKPLDEAFEFHPVICGKTTSEEHNLLHLMAQEFMNYSHEAKFLQFLVKDKRIIQDLIKMSN